MELTGVNILFFISTISFLIGINLLQAASHLDNSKTRDKKGNWVILWGVTGTLLSVFGAVELLFCGGNFLSQHLSILWK